MAKILFVASECFPAAKAGGLGDVVGALPKYLNEIGHNAEVIIPKYDLPFITKQKTKTLFESHFSLGSELIHFTIECVISNELGYPLIFCSIPGKFDRNSIYLADNGHGFKDEIARNISFQRAVLMWLASKPKRYDLLHCHDHITGLIPFMMKYCPEYKPLSEKPVVFTIHNGNYHGAFSWKHTNYLPKFSSQNAGLLEWDGEINSLAAAIKCAWHVNTVSPSYMKEIINQESTLKPLYNQEKSKCSGIINGIDTETWNPADDILLSSRLSDNDWKQFKAKNKQHLLKSHDLIARRPLMGFIGRFAHQKGVDLLCDAIAEALEMNLKISFIILGSGDTALEHKVKLLEKNYKRNVKSLIMYNEGVARKIYAGSDFLLMPSRFEPCGLNQLFAKRYGSIPFVNAVGGLRDTVVDVDQNDGEGIVMEEASVPAIIDGFKRAINLYQNKSKLTRIINRITQKDHSWHQSAHEYSELYHKFIPKQKPK